MTDIDFDQGNRDDDPLAGIGDVPPTETESILQRVLELVAALVQRLEPRYVGPQRGSLENALTAHMGR